jgi:hypothetical protein
MNIQTDSALLRMCINTVFRVVAAPWTFSLFSSQHQSDTFGPLPFAIIPFLLFIPVRKEIRFLLAAMGIYFGCILGMEIWFIHGGSNIRYSTFILLISAPAIVYVIASLAAMPRIRKLLMFMTVSLVILGTLLFVKRYHRDWIAHLTLQNRHEYLRSVLPEYPVIEQINALGDSTVVMPIYNYTDYLIDIPYITAYRKYETVDAMKKDLKAKRIGYIFANNKLDLAENARAFPKLTEKECVASENGYYLYKLLF